ncbi:MAG: MarR family transcriptional regulator [Chlorobi bacterium]|nr:MarR family transcriptional regulator [Chlorobiota bacterium]
MNRIVQLVNEWDSFESEHPDAEIEDFCRYFLARAEQASMSVPAPTATPAGIPDSGLLLKLMGRIAGAFGVYHRAAMAKTKLPFPDAFFYLNFLKQLGEIRKTELINSMVAEYTTGMEAINRLIRDGLIAERPDENDGRAKLVSLSKRGERVLAGCYEYVGKAGEMIFKGVRPDTLKLCIALLSGVEAKHSRLAVELKNREFDEMYGAVMNGEA